jgi:hypothetical protein
LGADRSGSAQASIEASRIPVYDAATLARDGAVIRDIRSSAPDVIVVRDVLSFVTLLQIRDSLELRGYSAAMSNFHCGLNRGVSERSVDVAILSRQPIEEAAEYDAPGANCVISGPFVAGPGAAVHEKRTISPSGWPRGSQRNGKPMPGPGILAVRIFGEAQPIVMVRLPGVADYTIADTSEIKQMRGALMRALGGRDLAGCRNKGCQVVTIEPATSTQETIRTAMR